MLLFRNEINTASRDRIPGACLFSSWNVGADRSVRHLSLLNLHRVIYFSFRCSLQSPPTCNHLLP